MFAYTDYPITRLGDKPGREAPVRQCTILSYDSDKYCEILVEGIVESVKAGYLYKSPGRLGEVPNITLEELNYLEPDFEIVRDSNFEEFVKQLQFAEHRSRWHDNVIIVISNGNVCFTWNDSANIDYPEDLTWNRLISNVFHDGVQAGINYMKSKADET